VLKDVGVALLFILCGAWTSVSTVQGWLGPPLRRCCASRSSAHRGAVTGGLRSYARTVRPLAARALPPHDIDGLLRELLPAFLTVNYTISREPGSGYQAAAEVALVGIQSRTFVGDCKGDEADALHSAIAVAHHSLVTGADGADGQSVPDVQSGDMELVKRWGEIAYTRAPLPVGLLMHFSTYRVGSGAGGAQSGFQTVLQVRLPAVQSQAYRGAYSKDEHEAKESAASIVHQALTKLVGSSAQEPRMVVHRPRQPGSSSPPRLPEDRGRQLARLLLDVALRGLRACSSDLRTVELPISGFHAVAEMQSPIPATTARKGIRPEVRTCRLRGEVRATREAAEESAMDEMYEALLQPVWKTTAVLSGPQLRRPVRSHPLTDEDLARFARWRAERLEAIDPEDGDLATGKNHKPSLDLWFGGVCLCCLAVVSHVSWRNHAAGGRHARSFSACPVRLRQDLKRVPTAPPVEFFHDAPFWEAAGWADPALPILSVGEMDFSFSLALARLRTPRSTLVATSYLEAFSPGELERYPEDDAERADFQRHALPAMAGALQQNLSELAELGAEVLHGVDATDLEATLRARRFGGQFGCAVFPFPRATLKRENDPRNSELVRGFLLNAAPGAGLVAADGSVQLVLLGTQYEEWDVAGAAADAGLTLHRRMVFERGFYQPREVSGREWDFGRHAELLCFTRAPAHVALEEQVPAELGGKDWRSAPARDDEQSRHNLRSRPESRPSRHPLFKRLRGRSDAVGRAPHRVPS